MSKIVQQVIGYHLGIKVDDVKPEMVLQEIGCDSLDCVEICMDIEDKFVILIDDQELLPIKTVQDIYDLVNKKQGEKPVNQHAADCKCKECTEKSIAKSDVTQQQEGTLREDQPHN